MTFDGLPHQHRWQQQPILHTDKKRRRAPFQAQRVHHIAALHGEVHVRLETRREGLLCERRHHTQRRLYDQNYNRDRRHAQNLHQLRPATLGGPRVVHTAPGQNFYPRQRAPARHARRDRAIPLLHHSAGRAGRADGRRRAVDGGFEAVASGVAVVAVSVCENAATASASVADD